MNPFEVRLEFVGLLSRLSSSLPSITKVASFALKHGPRCGDDIWDCLVDECTTMSLNQRINLLYFLDSLLDKQQSITPSTTTTSTSTASDPVQQPYKDLVKRDLSHIVELVVPDTREGILNLMSAQQVLKSWRTRRLLDSDILDNLLSRLEHRRQVLHSSAVNQEETAESTAFTSFSHQDIVRRIEDDRERHKRLRERIWVLPVPTSLLVVPKQRATTTATTTTFANSHKSNSSTGPSPISPASPSEIAGGVVTTKTGTTRAKSSKPLIKKDKSAMAPPPVPTSTTTTTTGDVDSDAVARGPEHAIEIEFEQLWDASEEELRDAFQTVNPTDQSDPTMTLVDPGLGSVIEAAEEGELEEGEETEQSTAVPSASVVTDEVKASESVVPIDGRKKRARTNSRGGWELDEAELAAMRQERRRCFTDID